MREAGKGERVKKSGLRGVNMKKASIGVLLLMGAALLGAQTGGQALIRETSGKVEIKGPGAAEWEAAEAGQVLERASLISTGFRSTALIRIGNSNITVRPLTRLSLEEIVAEAGGERVTLNLRAGRIRADVKPPVGGRTDFSVRSPIATASVRGTVFDFDGTRLSVVEGRVHLSGESVTGAYVGKGHATAVDTEKGNTAPVIERVKEEMAPALPAGMDVVPAAPAAAPVSGSLGIGLDW
jgi:hypothetical protein